VRWLGLGRGAALPSILTAQPAAAEASRRRVYVTDIAVEICHRAGVAAKRGRLLARGRVESVGYYGRRLRSKGHRVNAARAQCRGAALRIIRTQAVGRRD
jgi:hypothetical protein